MLNGLRHFHDTFVDEIIINNNDVVVLVLVIVIVIVIFQLGVVLQSCLCDIMVHHSASRQTCFTLTLTLSTGTQMEFPVDVHKMQSNFSFLDDTH